MKFIKFLSILTIFFSLIIFESCSDDADENESDPCEVGYEGVNCETLSRAKFIWSYSATKHCDNIGTGTKTSVITANLADDLRMTIDRGNDGDQIFDAIITGERTFDLPYQETCIGCPSFSGSGSMNEDGTLISLDYTFEDGMYCTHSLIRQ